jgi:hypothetical protein
MKHSAGILFALLAAACGGGLLAAACGGGLPARYVIERDLGEYNYRRYQETLDAELPIASNRARGHTAAYMHRSGQAVEVVTAFVSVYDKPARLTETVRAELATLPGYELRTAEVAGQYVWLLSSGTEASYWVWPAGRYVVKLGAGLGQALPDAIAEPYAALYPSDLDSYGHAREGSASGGSAPDEAGDPDELKPTAAPAKAAETPASKAKLAETSH